MDKGTKYLELILFEERLLAETKELTKELLFKCPPEEEKVVELKKSIQSSVKELNNIVISIEEDIAEVEDFYKEMEC